MFGSQSIVARTLTPRCTYYETARAAPLRSQAGVGGRASLCDVRAGPAPRPPRQQPGICDQASNFDPSDTRGSIR